MTPYEFGTVFSYNGNDYIYLVSDEDQHYAAMILNLPKSKMLNEAYTRKLRSNPKSSVLDGLIYSFVILETKELRNRIASFLHTGHERLDSLLFTTLNITLSQKDLKALKEEITKKRCPIIRLRDLVKGMNI